MYTSAQIMEGRNGHGTTPCVLRYPWHCTTKLLALY